MPEQYICTRLHQEFQCQWALILTRFPSVQSTKLNSCSECRHTNCINVVFLARVLFSFRWQCLAIVQDSSHEKPTKNRYSASQKCSAILSLGVWSNNSKHKATNWINELCFDDFLNIFQNRTTINTFSIHEYSISIALLDVDRGRWCSAGTTWQYLEHTMCFLHKLLADYTLMTGHFWTIDSE